VPEVDRPVSDAAWSVLVAAVHEEVQRLSDAERTAFVLCDLQGVTQADAAARLGWALGSVSARLCKARQRLLDRLTARGVAPAALAGVGLTAGVAGAVPAALFDTVKQFPATPLAASSGALVLAHGLMEGVAMRVKLTVVATVVVAALGLTGGAVWMSKADAQPTAPSAGSLGPPPGITPGTPTTSAGSSSGQPGGTSPLGPGGPLRADTTSSGRSGVTPGPTVWEHKFVDVKNDRKAFEQIITQHGKDGWEFCSSERFGQGDLVLVFKKRKGGDLIGSSAPSGSTPGGRYGEDGFGRPDSGDTMTTTFKLKHLKASHAADKLKEILAGRALRVTHDDATNSVFIAGEAGTVRQLLGVIEKIIADGDAKPAPTGGASDPRVSLGADTGFSSAGTVPVGSTPGRPTAGATLTVVTLKHAKAAELAEVLKQVFMPQGVSVTADPRTNQLIIRSDDASVPAVKRIIEQLDVSVPR
jgi:hypothetical protein